MSVSARSLLAGAKFRQNQASQRDASLSVGANDSSIRQISGCADGALLFILKVFLFLEHVLIVRLGPIHLGNRL